MSMQHSRGVGVGSPHGDASSRSPRPFKGRALWWKIVFAVPLSVMLCGVVVAIYGAYHDSRSVFLWNMAGLLVVSGFAIGVVCLGVWVASGGHLPPSNQP